MEYQSLAPLLACLVQVMGVAVGLKVVVYKNDVYMKPLYTTAASFCMRMIGWVRRVSAASMVLHVLAIVPTRRVADRQTTTLSVRRQSGLHTRVHRGAHDGHRRRSCRR